MNFVVTGSVQEFPLYSIPTTNTGVCNNYDVAAENVCLFAYSFLLTATLPQLSTPFPPLSLSPLYPLPPITTPSHPPQIVTHLSSHRYPLFGFHDEVVVLHGHGDDAAVGRGLARVVVTHGVVARGAVVRGQHLVQLLRWDNGEL